MKIAMVGSGYVVWSRKFCFADSGHEVACVDKDASEIDRLESVIMPIYEPGLDALVEANAKAGRLSFTTDLAAAFGVHRLSSLQWAPRAGGATIMLTCRSSMPSRKKSARRWKTTRWWSQNPPCRSGPPRG